MLMTMIDVARSYVGVEEGSAAHRSIINIYNTIRPLPRGYKMTYQDAWCAAFVTVCYMRAYGVPEWAECGCQEMLNKFKKMGEEKSFRSKPQIGDLIFYDFRPDKWADHVGIISNIGDNSYIVVEGNMADRVGYRELPKNSKDIIGYGFILSEESINYNPTLNQLAQDVIKGKFGNAEERKEKIYRLVQDRVNYLLRG